MYVDGVAVTGKNVEIACFALVVASVVAASHSAPEKEGFATGEGWQYVEADTDCGTKDYTPAEWQDVAVKSPCSPRCSLLPVSLPAGKEVRVASAHFQGQKIHGRAETRMPDWETVDCRTMMLKSL